MKKYLLAAVFTACVLSGQEVSKPEAKPEPKPAPKITGDQRSAYWRAQLELQVATEQQEKAKISLQKAMDSMRATCGENWTLTADQQGEALCVAKTPPTAEKK